MARGLLSDSSSDSDSDSNDGGAALPPTVDLKVNEAYARRFEYNKKREEKMRLEDKLGKTRKRKRDDDKGDDGGDDDEGDSDESTSESEDDGELDTEAVDAEMMATIAAIRNRDPKIYDPNTKFYTSIEEDGEGGEGGEGGEDESSAKQKKEKPLHLRDYHRENLLNGTTAADDNEEQPLPYNEEQARLKQEIVSSMHAAAENDENDDDGFLTAKEKPKTASTIRAADETTLDVENADKDPEKFLSNFMASRAWAMHNDDRNLVPFESDDDEEDKRADEYEEAYNMRFEDPAKANEKLRSHARDMAAKYSVRREEANPRQRKREAEKAKKEAAKQERKEEKARLRKLRIEEVEAKVRRIKHAAGIKSSEHISPEDWQRLLDDDDDWDDNKWEEEMQKRFGDEYYAAEDAGSDEDEDDDDDEDTPADQKSKMKKKKKAKKPKFDDDIDIKDLVPDYEDEDEQPSLSQDEADGNNGDNDNGPAAEAEPEPELESKSKSKSSKVSANQAKAEARRDRRIIEALVDDQLKLDFNRSSKTANGAHSSTGGGAGFRYRATSPQSFGLTAEDILLAEDAQLNQFAGLKKLASFRDPDKKKRDKKTLGKKGRLRKWREEVFGKQYHQQDSVVNKQEDGGKKNGEEADAGVDGEHEEGNDDDGPRKKKKRRRKNKSAASTSDPAAIQA